MSLVRDTFLVGGATFLVGSVLMEISVKQEGEPVGWWPYVGTFIAGSLGFYLLAATNVVKVKNAESFAAVPSAGTGSPGQMCEVCNESDDLPYDSDHFKECRRCGKSVCHECWDTDIESDEHYYEICGECWIVLDNVARYDAESFSAECEACGKPRLREDDICEDCETCLECCVREGFCAESFSADSISICGVCSVAGHRHCGQTTGCPCCEIRVKKESQRPTCNDCGELKSSTPQEYNQWTCWPCRDAAGGGYHGTECYCSSCMGVEYDAETFSAEGPTDDELESWSERQDDGSMLVTIDEDGDSHTELTYKDGDLTDLKRFMAEIFEADRKARRRTTLTWARGIESGFGTIDDDGDIHFSKPRPYDNDQYSFHSQYSNDNAYHIKGLPPGFHIHLWKPPKRGAWWQAYLKSPNTDEWKEVYSQSKRNLMVEVLEWYNDAIASPEEVELTPIQQLMVGQGMITGGIQIYRIHIPAAIQKKKDKITGEVVSKTIIGEKVQYYYAGDGHEPTLFAVYDGVLDFPSITVPTAIRNFCRGLIYLDTEKAGNLRSVNRYNKNPKQWVSSHPSWFQNMCKEGITNVYFAHDSLGNYLINDHPFLRFYNGNNLPIQYLKNMGEDIRKNIFQVNLPTTNADGKTTWAWTTPRPTTQKKMYKIHGKSGSEKLGHETDVGIFNKCVAKYQPQKWEKINRSMKSKPLLQNTEGFNLPGSEPAGHIMCRRFKKK